MSSAGNGAWTDVVFDDGFLVFDGCIVPVELVIDGDAAVSGN